MRIVGYLAKSFISIAIEIINDVWVCLYKSG